MKVWRMEFVVYDGEVTVKQGRFDRASVGEVSGE